jgi:anaerobic selenocysteine-containing dehydrogenase
MDKERVTMGTSRRNFIKFTAGGIAGIHMTPLPFKLMDDVAIWTQNWPWVPVPPEGEFTHVKSVCTLCHGGCGIEVRKVDERAIKIEGRTDYPVNPGGICAVGMGGLQLLYNKSIRYTGPMRRVGKRGSGKFVGITWPEALHELAVRISYLRKTERSESVVTVDGNPVGSTMSAMIERLTRAIGSPNYTRLPSLEDTYHMGSFLMHGTDSPIAYDLENADYILSFGCGFLEGWGSSGRVMNAWSILRDKALEGKARVVQIESRASNTASKADLWVAPRPGTDGALALGIAHMIIKNGWYDAKFVNDYSFGFNDWISKDGTEHVGFKTIVLENYPPDKVAKITGVSAEKVKSLAEAFAYANAPLAVYGKGKGTLNGGIYEFMAVHSLNALVGNIDRPGGVLLFDPVPLGPFPAIKADTTALKNRQKPRIDQAGSKRYPFAKSLINNLFETILESNESPVDTLLVFSGNPAYTLPGSNTVEAALQKIPFVVSFSPFQDETSYMADLILPDHTYLEKMDDIVCPTGLQYPMYGLSKPVVKPLYDTKSTGDVIIQLAQRLGQSIGSAFPWENYEEVLKTRAKGLFNAGGDLVTYEDSEPPWKWRKKRPMPDYSSSNEMWEKMKSGGMWYRPVCSSDKRERHFKTPTSKFAFFSTQIELAINEYAEEISESDVLENMGIDAKGDEVYMPHYERILSPTKRPSHPLKILPDNIINLIGNLMPTPPTEDKTIPDDQAMGNESFDPLAPSYALKMVPYDMINLASDWLPSPPFLYKTILDNQLLRNESFVSINPKTASKYELKQGDRVIIQSPKGEVRVRVNLSEGAMPGIVYLPMGFGHTAYDEFNREKGVNPNDIIQTRKDPLSGHPVWWDTPVKLIKA